MIQRIGHINIRTPLFEETLTFYEAVFGLRRGTAKTMADPTRNAWLYDHDGRALIHVNMPTAGEAVPPPEYAAASIMSRSIVTIRMRPRSD